MLSTASVKPGDVLAGKYRVERVLGAGGMGYVVAARHLQLDQLVAMKFLRKDALDNTEAGMRFLREAKAVVRLRNEHVAKVYDVGTLETGEPYIVMEHLEGCDLAALVKQRRLVPAGEAAAWVLQACEGLAEAHAIGIVHRDIKLANLFVTRGPSGGPLVKVLDFGVSKSNPLGDSEHEMTRTASMLGSPRFMSPEQMRDPRAVDPRSDIWSLGVVLYRLVSGRPPFEADTLGRLLTMVMHEQETPLSSLCKDLPPGFEHVVARCLQKNPAARFKNVADLAYALVPFLADPVRARSTADRIAAVLRSPTPPPATDGPERRSTPMGPVDNGTAAPWVGTRPRRTPSASTVWLGVALAALLVGTGVFARFHRDEQTAAAARATVNHGATQTVQTIERTSLVIPVEAAPSGPHLDLAAAGEASPRAPSVPSAGMSGANGARRAPRITAPAPPGTEPAPPARSSTPAPLAPNNERSDESGIPDTRD